VTLRIIEEQKVVCVSDWVEVSSPPDETSASLMEGMLREAVIPAFIPEPAIVEAWQLPEDTIGLGLW
jgi:hypothetical protein